MNWIAALFSFSGRANRQPYWLTALGLVCATFLAAILTPVPAVGFIVALFLYLGSLVAGLAMAARRIHDRGRSGWWLVPMHGPLLVLSFMAGLVDSSGGESGAVFQALILPFSIWIFVDLGCLRGTKGPNRFGRDPLQPLEQVFS